MSNASNLIVPSLILYFVYFILIVYTHLVACSIVSDQSCAFRQAFSTLALHIGQQGAQDKAMGEPDLRWEDSRGVAIHLDKLGLFIKEVQHAITKGGVGVNLALLHTMCWGMFMLNFELKSRTQSVRGCSLFQVLQAYMESRWSGIRRGVVGLVCKLEQAVWWREKGGNVVPDHSLESLYNAVC